MKSNPTPESESPHTDIQTNAPLMQTRVRQPRQWRAAKRSIRNMSARVEGALPSCCMMSVRCRLEVPAHSSGGIPWVPKNELSPVPLPGWRRPGVEIADLAVFGQCHWRRARRGDFPDYYGASSNANLETGRGSRKNCGICCMICRKIRHSANAGRSRVPAQSGAWLARALISSFFS